MINLTVALAVVVGISLGLLGGGGSILTVPLLTYVAGLDARAAITTSLMVVGVTSAFAAVTHARSGRVRWRVAMLLGSTAMAGAYTGGRLARFVPGTILLVAFAVIMVAAGTAMLRGRREAAAVDRPLPLLRIILLGAAVGVTSGLVGAGGGFLLVPALGLFAGLPMPVAVGTSLAVISMQCFAGLAGHLTTQQIDWRLAGLVTTAGVVGALIGGRLVAFVDAKSLRRMFGWFVLLVAAVILAQEIHPAVGAATAALTLVAAVTSFVCTRYRHCPLRRLIHRPLAPAATG